MVRSTDLHRVYIQTLLARRAMPVEVAQQMFKRAVSAVRNADPEFHSNHRMNKEGYDAFTAEVHQLLEPLGFALKIAQDQVTGTPWLVLRNAEAGDVAKVATDLTPLEISYFRALIEAIVSSGLAYSLGSVAALNLVGELTGKMMRSDAEALLAALVARNWLQESERGRFSLAPRAIAELESYLKDAYADDLLQCTHCNRLMMAGVTCAADGCGASYHTFCFKSLRGMAGACIRCRTPFADTEPGAVGEDAVPRREDNHGRRPKRRRRTDVNGLQSQTQAERRAVGDEDGVEDEDRDEEDETLDAPPPARQRRSGRVTRSSVMPRTPVAGGSRRETQAQEETIIPDSVEYEDSDDGLYD